LLGGSRLKVSAMDTPVNVKLLMPPRQSRGVSQRTSNTYRITLRIKMRTVLCLGNHGRVTCSVRTLVRTLRNYGS